MFVALLARGEVAVSRSRSVPERNSASECVASRMVVESTSRLRPRSGKSVKSERPRTSRQSSVAASTTSRREEERRVRAEGCVRRHSNSGTSAIQGSGRCHDTLPIRSPLQIVHQFLDLRTEVLPVRPGVAKRREVGALELGCISGFLARHDTERTTSQRRTGDPGCSPQSPSIH